MALVAKSVSPTGRYEGKRYVTGKTVLSEKQKRFENELETRQKDELAKSKRNRAKFEKKMRHKQIMEGSRGL